MWLTFHSSPSSPPPPLPSSLSPIPLLLPPPQQVNKWHLASTSDSGNRLKHLQPTRTIAPKDLHAASFLNLGTILLEFLQLYGRSLNLGEVGISLRGGGCYFSKRAR